MRFVFFAVLLALPAPAFAQFYAHPLFVEALRDPGRPDAASSPRASALGGQSVEGAEASLSSPSLLPVLPPTQLAVWGGYDAYRRHERRLTPAQLSTDPESRLSARNWTPSAGAAIAIVRGRWAGAAFATSTAFEHRFDTDEHRLSQSFAHGSAFWVDGSGSASAMVRQTRIGGAGAVVLNRWFGIGASVSAVRLRHEVIATVNTITCTQTFPTPAVCGARVPDIASSTIADTRPAFALSATLFAGGIGTSITGRWQHEPRFTGEREGLPVALDLPDVAAVSVRASLRDTAVTAEIAREHREGAFVSDPAAPDHCGAARIPDCLGWGIGEYELLDATTLRAGIEQRVMSARLVLRGGYAFEPARLLSLGRGDGIDPAGAVHRISGGLGVKTGTGGAIEVSVSRDRHELVIAAGYRFSLR